MERAGSDMPGGRGAISMRDGIRMMLKGDGGLSGGPYSEGIDRGSGQPFQWWEGSKGESPKKRRFTCLEEPWKSK